MQAQHELNQLRGPDGAADSASGNTSHRTERDMSLFRLDASIRVEGSHSRAIADIVEQEWWNARPGEAVIRRHVGVDPIPATAWATAVFADRTPEESRTD